MTLRRLRRFAAFLAAAVVASACSGTPTAERPDSNEVWPGDTPGVEEPNDLALTDDPVPSSTDPPIDRGGPWSLTVEHELLDDTVRLDLVAPQWAAEAQVASEPSFAGAAWFDVGDRTHHTAHTGVQELFVRYRTSSGESIGGVTANALRLIGPVRSMTGDELDPTAIRLTRVAPDVLQLDFRIGDVVYGEDGAAYVPGPDVDVPALMARDDLSVTVDQQPLEVVEVGRWAAPTGQIDAEAFAMAHRVHLRVDGAVPDGSIAVVLADGTTVEHTLSAFDFSPAVHTTQLGWAADDGGKRAYTSVWTQLPTPIEPGAATGWVIDDADLIVLDVRGEPFRTDRRTELWRGDLTGAPTTSFDLTALTTPGRYRFCVEAIGCSSRFDITADGEWQGLAATVARSLFHQRSGIELGAPHTAISRPRPYHPDDGMVIRASDQTLLADPNGRGDGERFVDLVSQATDQQVEGAWGGHFDGGDWDRRIQHLWMVRRLIDLVDEFPDSMAPLDLNIPESGDAIPDLLDEARWSLDLFRRMQLSDGSIRGGIEAAGHPADGSTSWTEELDVFAYAPDPWSTAIYAGVAADMALVIERYEPSLAADYGESALAAMRWVEDRIERAPETDGDVATQRSIAAISLYRLTGDERWHDLFLELSDLDERPVLDPCILATSCEASWRYVRLPDGLGDDDVRRRAEESIVRVAEELLNAADTTAYDWVPEGANVQLLWGLGPSIPHTVGLLRAHLLTGDDRFRDQAVINANFTLGANPTGRSWVTGVGHDAPENLLMVDQMNAGIPIWPGTPVYGPFTTWQTPFWYVDAYLRPAGTTPDHSEWPTLQTFVDVGLFAGQSEFTVQQGHGEAIWTFGALAGTTGDSR